MSIKKSAVLFGVTLSMAAFMSACSSDTKEGSTSALANVGDTKCYQCHSAVNESLTGESIIAQYERSPHFGTVGCEGCHGSGAMHNGVGPIPNPKPDVAVCTSCHTSTTAGKYAESNHAILDLHYSATSTTPVCLRCHSHEGAVLFNQQGVTGAQPLLNSAPISLDRDGTKFQAITCATCHEHGGALRAQKTLDNTSNIVAWDPNKNFKVDQFDLCTGCHTLIDNDGTTLVASGTVIAGRTPYFHNNRWTRMIATTHYDDPATGVGLATNKIEGYVVRTKGANPCFDCHGHEAKTATGSTTESTIHTDWAKSAHAGGLLNQKLAAVAANPTRNDAQVDAVIAAGVDATTGPAWEHYDWDSASRASCQRCHTSTGAANFMTNPATYNSANNNFSHLSGWNTTTKTSPQNELLYCWGCHTNAGTGALRTPGAITETYSPGTAGDPATTIAYPDIAGSNVCMTCHLGREAGDVIKNDQDADGVRSFINSHYLAAGGQLFGTTGYEFTGRNYANPAYFAHDKIGLTAAGTGSNGPCVGCHMKNSNSHKFSIVSTSSNVITKIQSQAVCNTCHTGEYAITAANLEEEAEAYHAALEDLKAALAAKGIHFYEAHPYFYTGAGGTGGAFTNWAGVYGLSSWKDVMGAAFNANLLLHDPGGYAHNRYYSKRLIYDSIDFIEDGTLNGSITMTLSAEGAAYLDANATTAGIQRP